MNPLLALLGAFSSPIFIARKGLKQLIAASGLDPDTYPINELAEHSLSSAKFQGTINRGWYKNYLHDSITATGHTVVYITTGESIWAFDKMTVDDNTQIRNPVWQILAKHDPSRFAMENLSQTQRKMGPLNALGRIS